MSRMGHASMRAALIYQHATTDRDAAIAVALSELAGQATPTSATESGPTARPSSAPLSARGRARPGATGTRRARGASEP